MFFYVRELFYLTHVDVSKNENLILAKQHRHGQIAVANIKYFSFFVGEEFFVDGQTKCSLPKKMLPN